eukprot:4369153-Pyramimonas_sp.AAC.1
MRGSTYLFVLRLCKAPMMVTAAPVGSHHTQPSASTPTTKERGALSHNGPLGTWNFLKSDVFNADFPCDVHFNADHHISGVGSSIAL